MFSLNAIAVYTLVLPLITSIVIGLNTRNFKPITAQIISISGMLLAVIFSLIIFNNVIFLHTIIHIKLFKWFDFGGLKAFWSIYIDSLTAVMLIVVNIISTLVHIYSVGYMSHDPSKQRFMSYLSLFTFFMLLLVVSDNLLQLFVGWEGVGLCSFLLIGFWLKKESAKNAALKAFLVNRVGDIGLVLSVILIYITFQNVEYQYIFSHLNSINYSQVINILGFNLTIIDVICICMFIGCVGKSAQLGLHVWLPDAMEGPTPVSALIHAATMVTAGVFLLARCSFIFECSPISLSLITVIGAVTCVFAATIALVQNDIKKIIAYSTCSQLGYMFFACGLSAYSAAIFHLFTHAFFKALLFLGAGGIIHAIGNEQDIRKMGGLRRYLPISYMVMWIGSLALAGIIPFAGYFSKDLILESAYLTKTDLGNFAYTFGIIAAFFTAFYSWRLIFVVFHGNTKVKKSKLEAGLDEPSSSMMVPLLTLMMGAIFSGYTGAKRLGMDSAQSSFWHSALAIANTDQDHSIETFFQYLPMIVSLLGIILAYVFYCTNCSSLLKKILSFTKIIYNILLNKYYFDSLYDSIFVKPIRKLGIIFWKIIDNSIIDGFPNGIAKITIIISKRARLLQFGAIPFYTTMMYLGIISIIYYIVYIR